MDCRKQRWTLLGFAAGLKQNQVACRQTILGGLLAVQLVLSANAAPIHDAVSSDDVVRVEEVRHFDLRHYWVT
jgi:hypothetical protein